MKKSFNCKQIFSIIQEYEKLIKQYNIPPKIPFTLISVTEKHLYEIKPNQPIDMK